jgi:Domain of unknown function (DUF4424)
MKRYAVRVVAISLSCPFLLNVLHSLANDSAAELSIGGLRFTQTADISMESEDLEISLDRVGVHYRFLNKAEAPITLKVAFPLPDIDLSQAENFSFPGSDPANFVSFETRIGGDPVKFTIVQQALIGNNDVTSVLRELKVPILPLEPQQFRAQDLPRESRNRLVNDGLLLPAGSDERGRPLYEPGWIVRTSVVRDQTFPANQPVLVEHSYRPIIGASADTILKKQLRQNKSLVKEVERYRRDYCVSDNFLSELDKLAGSGGGAAIQERRLTYVLKTGANWAGPIKDFRLKIDGEEQGWLISFCPGRLQKPPNESAYVAKDFMPDQDLKILFVGRF